MKRNITTHSTLTELNCATAPMKIRTRLIYRIRGAAAAMGLLLLMFVVVVIVKW
jgi:hypothetical protein